MGWSDSPHVEDWLEDVQFIEHELAQRNLLPDLVYTSALGRARHTGDYLAGQFGRTARHSQQLNEVDYGELAEKPKKWVSANFPLHKVDPDFTYPGGESFSGMQSRAVACLDGLAAAHPDEMCTPSNAGPAAVEQATACPPPSWPMRSNRCWTSRTRWLRWR